MRLIFILHCVLQDVGLYICGAKNEMNGNGDKVDGIVYLNMDAGNVSSLPYQVFLQKKWFNKSSIRVVKYKSESSKC